MKLAAALVAILACIVYIALHERKDHGTVLHGYVQAGDIKRVPYDGVSWHDLARSRVPVILRGSPILQWKAMYRWSENSYLVESIATISGVRNGSSNVFTYRDADAPMAKQGFVSMDTTESEYVTVPMQRFLQQDCENLYFSDVLHPENPFLALLDDMEPLSVLSFPEEQDDIDMQSNNIWIGCQNVTAQTHYDVGHNLFAQIRGTKTFVMSPPSDLSKALLYSVLHPSARQSQIDFEYVDSSGAPPFEPLTAAVAQLHPGDLLYIPPYWLHRVIAQSLSISINRWTTSLEMRLKTAIANVEVPGIELLSSDPKEALYQFTVFLVGLLRKMDSTLDGIPPALFVAEIVDTRLSYLYDIEEFNADRCFPIHAISTHMRQEQTRPSIDHISSLIASSARQLGPHATSIHQTMLRDYIEQTTGFLIGIPKMAPYLLCVSESFV